MTPFPVPVFWSDKTAKKLREEAVKRAEVSCEVLLNSYDCECPPGSDCAPIRTRCFSCGQKACKADSKIRPYRRYGKRRVCRDCVESGEM